MDETYVGIDISKDYLDVASVPSREKWRYGNDDIGIAKLIETLKELGTTLVVLEPTGGLEPEFWRQKACKWP